MALAGFETYAPTITDFETHWTMVNSNRPAPLVLADGSTLADLGILKANVIASISDANNLTNAATTETNAYASARALIYIRMGQFRRAAAYYLAGKGYSSKISPLPKVTKDDGELFKAADTYIYAWGMANADNSLPSDAQPLVLDGGYTLSDFQGDIAALRTLQAIISGADNAASTARNVRDGFCARAKAVLLAYRKAILALYAPDSNEVKTLPAVSPSNKPAPDAPKLKVDYTDGQSKAKLNWTIAAVPTLTRFYVNVCPGARYSDKIATRLGELDAAQRAYETADGTIAAGATVWFKVIAVDEDENEAASNAIKVVRSA